MKIDLISEEEMLSMDNAESFMVARDPSDIFLKEKEKEGWLPWRMTKTGNYILRKNE